jgi:hypothetical protein
MSKKPVFALQLFLAIGLANAPPLDAHDLVAVTRSGEAHVVGRVDGDVEKISISFKGLRVSLTDPVVDIRGLAELDELRELHFYHVPQIESFDFLAECRVLERVIISFARVRDVDFLARLPGLRLLYLEICDDWESEIGLPFLDEPFDLSANPLLEFLAFRACNLNRVPVISSVPDTLRIVDLSYNAIAIDIRDREALDTLADVERVYINGNSVERSELARYGNLTHENGDGLLIEYLGE